jgi:hypothetical protein
VNACFGNYKVVGHTEDPVNNRVAYVGAQARMGRFIVGRDCELPGVGLEVPGLVPLGDEFAAGLHGR